jgi:hypothetical protein
VRATVAIGTRYRPTDVALSAAAGLEMSSEGVCVPPGFLAAGAAQMLCAVVRSDDSRRRRRESKRNHSTNYPDFAEVPACHKAL